MKNMDLLNQIYNIIRNYQGTDPVIIYPLDENDQGHKKTYKLKDMGVYASDDLKLELNKLMDEKDIVMK